MWKAYVSNMDFDFSNTWGIELFFEKYHISLNLKLVEISMLVKQTVV